MRGIKAVYYKKEVMSVRVNDAIPINYNIAKRMFNGYFGNATYVCDELMICYRAITDRLSELEYDKISHAFRGIGFNIYITQKGDSYIAGMIPEYNVLRYVNDKSLRLGRFNVETLSHLT